MLGVIGSRGTLTLCKSRGVLEAVQTRRDVVALERDDCRASNTH